MKARGLGGQEAQALFAKWMRHEGYNVAEAGKRVKFQTSDLFGCLDALGLLDGEDEDTIVWGAQVTTAEGRHSSSGLRKKKLESVEWPRAWRISLVNHERVPDPADRNKSHDYWRVQEYALHGAVRSWEPARAIRFDRRAVEEAHLAPRRKAEADELAALRARVAKIAP